ncbi:MAG: endonuclease/exonuclease/phosphatase family protein [Acidobacteriota bacterium]|nr:endonuclease/exonuclease/phosphatase family protein [Acidobacteriota bacterium]
MRIASFNVENLFSRARALNQETWAEGKGVLAAYSRLNTRLQQPAYSDADKQLILDDLDVLGLKRSDESAFAILRQNRGGLVKRAKNTTEIVAAGREDWVGWVELKTEAVNVVATRMTAKVIQDVNADVLAVVEAEDRIALKRFNDQLLKAINATYECIMLIDGNDDRGIDVGLMTKSDIDIAGIVSHVDDSVGGRRIFSRDCPEFTVRAGDKHLVVMVNHFKSKGFGTPAASNARRKEQAARVREIYELRREEGVEAIAIVGDFNDTPASDPLRPLLGDGSDLRDITEHERFVGDGRPGTFGNGTASNKIDYVLLSPYLFERVTAGGIWRRGVWGGKHGTLFPHYEEMTSPTHAASDHAAIWADVEL